MPLPLLAWYYIHPSISNENMTWQLIYTFLCQTKATTLTGMLLTSIGNQIGWTLEYMWTESQFSISLKRMKGGGS